MNQLFYNIAGGIVHQIRREKRTTISEVIVRGKRNIMQNRNWLYFSFLLKARVLYLTILKLKLELQTETRETRVADNFKTEARVALGYRLGQLLRFFRALQTSRVPHNSIVHAKA